MIMQYGKQLLDKEHLKEDTTLLGYNIIEEQYKHKDFVQIKEILQHGKASQSVTSKNII